MSFIDFFQQNILLFIAAGGIFIFLIIVEVRNRTSSKFTQSPVEFTQAINSGATLIDLRRSDDYRDGHIAGARHIAFEDLANHFDGLAKDKPVALYCYSGGFSGKAVVQMQKAGFAQVTHLGGGIKAWETDNLPLTID